MSVEQAEFLPSVPSRLSSLLRIRESPAAAIGLALVLFWVAMALLAPWIAPYSPNAQDFKALAKPTFSAAHWLGTDELGRDLVSRLLYGARRVLTVAPAAVAAAYTLGIALGLVAGYFGGWIDAIVSRLADVLLSFPILVLYVILIASIGASALNIILAVMIASSPGISRIVRGLVLDLRNNEYVLAARMRGESAIYVMLAEILPNARGPLIIDACLRLGYVTITIGTLGFLGLGLPPPDPDWGGMVKTGAQLVFVFPHMALVPCAALVSLIVGFNLLADGLRELSFRD